MAITVIVLIEYIFNLSILKSVLYLHITIFPLAAIIYLFFSISLTIKNNPHSNYKYIANILCLFVLILCLLMILDVLFGFNIHVERIILKEESDRFNSILRNETAFTDFNFILPMFNLIFLGISIIFIDYETKNKIRPVQFLCFFNILTVLVQLYAWLYHISPILKQLSFTILGSLCIYLLTLSVLFSRANKGVMKTLVGDYSIENISLRILALVLPLILGWLKLEGERLGMYSSELGTAIFAIFAFILSDALLTRNALLQEKARMLREESIDKVKKSEERFKMVLDNIGEGVSVANEKGKVIFQNRVSENLFGKNAWKIREKDSEYFKFYSNEGLSISQNDLPLYRSIRGKVIKDQEVIVKSSEFPEGVTLNVNSDPIKDEYGKVIESVAVFRDITYRKNVEVLHEEEERTLSAILMSIGEGVVILDPQSKVVLFNRKATEILGKKFDESVKIEDWPAYFGFYHSDKKRLIVYDELTLIKTIREQKINRAKFYIKNDVLKEGKIIESKSVPVFDEYGKINAAVAVFREIKSGV
jgi:PAS domain S-box-containing protein